MNGVDSARAVRGMGGVKLILPSWEEGGGTGIAGVSGGAGYGARTGSANPDDAGDDVAVALESDSLFLLCVGAPPPPPPRASCSLGLLTPKRDLLTDAAGTTLEPEPDELSEPEPDGIRPWKRGPPTAFPFATLETATEASTASTFTPKPALRLPLGAAAPSSVASCVADTVMSRSGDATGWNENVF